MRLRAAVAGAVMCLLVWGRVQAGTAPPPAESGGAVDAGRRAAAAAAPTRASVQRVEAAPNGDASAASGERAPLSPSDAGLVVRVLRGGVAEELALGDYLACVVAGEMPSSFPAAALEAQAVAARSLVYYRYGNPKHEGAEVCDDSGCCMAFGEANDASRAAVAATDGCVATYGGEAIMAAFFASCDGVTRDAEDVWGAAVPYLVSVASGEDIGAKGHGVGMSQYGAAEMARRGAGWREILRHYYSGVEV